MSLSRLFGLLFAVLLCAAACVVHHTQAQGPAAPQAGAGQPASDVPLVEQLVLTRRNYQRILEQLRFYYIQQGDHERIGMTEEELIGWHRIRKHAFIEALECPPPNLKGDTNIVDANNLLSRAQAVMGHGWGTDYIDNQRRAEILLQELITKYPQSTKISDAAFYLGEIYESKANEMYRRAAWYYCRCYQWHSNTGKDARLRAARIYDHRLKENEKARENYLLVLQYETDPAQKKEAEHRLAELSKKR